MKGECRGSECLSVHHEEQWRERKDPEISNEKLHLTGEEYAKLFEALPDALLIADTTGKIVQINAQLEKLFGYRKEELVGESLEILMPQRFRALHRRHVSNYLANPRFRPLGTGLELFGLRKDGTEFPVDISLNYTMTDDVFLAMATIRDITEHKSAQRKIELNYRIQKAISAILKLALKPLALEEQLSHALDLILTIPGFAEHSRISIFLVEKDPEILVLKAFHGFSVTQVELCRTVLVGRKPSREGAAACFMVATDCLEEHHDIQFAVRESYGLYCAPIVSDARTMGLINVAVKNKHHRVPEEEEFLLAIANTLAGLIERHQAEMSKRQIQEQLAESFQLAAIVASSDDAIIGKTLDGTIVSWNRGAERIYGYTAEEVIGKPISALIPSDRAYEITNILERIRRGERVEHYETERIRKNGQRIAVSVTVSPVKDRAGNIIGASAIARDITRSRKIG